MTTSTDEFLTELQKIFAPELMTIVNDEITVKIPFPLQLEDKWKDKETALRFLLIEQSEKGVYIEYKEHANLMQGGLTLLFRAYKISDPVEITHIKTGLKFCPECGQRLDQHPHNREVVSCYLHGDFLIIRDPRGQWTIRWRPLRLAASYIDEPTPEKGKEA